MTLTATSPQPAPRLDIGLVLKGGWRLFVRDLGPLLVAALVAVALTIVTLGILAGPLLAGLYGMVVGRVRAGRAARVGDLFARMDRFWSYLLAALVLGLAIGLASVTVVGGFFLATIWLYVFPLMVDRGLGFGEALTASKDMVMRAGFWEHLALVIVLVVVVSVLHGPLVLLGTPIVVAIGGAAYFVADGEVAALAIV